jgi:hypothetical protein
MEEVILTMYKLKELESMDAMTQLPSQANHFGKWYDYP